MRLFRCMAVPVFAAAVLPITLSPIETAVAQEEEQVAPALLERMAQEKAARKACKVQICRAFQKPSTGQIKCDVTKTLLRQDILKRVVGGSYAWGYGHTQCRFKLAIDAAPLSQALKQDGGTVSVPQHTLTCDVDDRDPAKGRAFTVKVSVTPQVTFGKGKATAASISPVRTEGSSLASAAITSIIAVDKVTGLVSKAIAAEVNEFIYTKCSDEGVAVAAN